MAHFWVYSNTCAYLRFQTTGYSGTLGGMEPLYIVRTGLCNIKGLMNSMPFDQVQSLD
jgi:hypothetical protein